MNIFALQRQWFEFWIGVCSPTPQSKVIVVDFKRRKRVA